MGRPFIVVGDQTDHGGVVVGSSVTTDTHGKRIARVGDQVTCPRRGHGTTVIVSGDPTMIIDGQPAARHGDKCACGATLIAGQAVSTTSEGGTSDPVAASANQASQAAAAGVVAPKPPVRFIYDEKTRLEVDGDTATLVGLPWFVRTPSGQTHSGRLNQSGELLRIVTDSEEEYEVFWGEDALVLMGDA